MKSLLVRALVTVRMWLGLNDPIADRLRAALDWLLPPVPQRAQPVPVEARGSTAPRR